VLYSPDAAKPDAIFAQRLARDADGLLRRHGLPERIEGLEERMKGLEKRLRTRSRDPRPRDVNPGHRYHGD
jgi:hypothetical protein